MKVRIVIQRLEADGNTEINNLYLRMVVKNGNNEIAGTYVYDAAYLELALRLKLL
ncbi:hypothetical protein [Anabaena azotica]|uniref:hypothetical protein n=1 Tax=Anabaena azotica TaxID=197653 RepID=UPI0039A76D86